MRTWFLAIFSSCLLLSFSATAQQHVSVCHAIAERQQPFPNVMKASLLLAAIDEYEVQISYVGHSTFRIESAKGVTIETDFDGSSGGRSLPNIVTMNHAHETHYTDYPDPKIKHVLRGWNPEGGAAKHDLVEQDVYVRNVPTDIYNYGTLIEENGNSIFVFEVAGLCIGHLGHLHHPLTPQHIAEIGRLDVMFAPVDGTYTLSQEAMADVAKKLRASILIPMHYFSRWSLDDFLDKMRSSFTVQVSKEAKLKVSLNNLPASPTVIVLPLDY